jgi:peptidoglycan/LPS O-acetylase OafA/YrhL
LAAAAVYLIVFAHTGLHLAVTPLNFFKQSVHWLSLGLLRVDTFDLNGYPESNLILAGVTWTLQSEWWFYFSLPIIGLVTRLPVRSTAALTLVGLAGSFYHLAHDGTGFAAALFCVGMSGAALEQIGWRARVPDWLASVAVMGLLGLTYAFSPNGYQTLPIALVGVAFYFIISGATLFGLLTTQAARRLGNVSYGIYLLQGLVFTLVFAGAPMRDFALASPARYWAMMVACGLLLLITATLAHVLIERPGIDLGKRTVTVLQDWRKRCFPRAKNALETDLTILTTIPDDYGEQPVYLRDERPVQGLARRQKGT